MQGWRKTDASGADNTASGSEEACDADVLVQCVAGHSQKTVEEKTDVVALVNKGLQKKLSLCSRLFRHTAESSTSLQSSTAREG